MQDVTYNASYREGMPKAIEVDHVPHFNYKDPTNSLKVTLEALENLITKNGNIYCAISIELIQGEAGFIYGTKEYRDLIQCTHRWEQFICPNFTVRKVEEVENSG